MPAKKSPAKKKKTPVKKPQKKMAPPRVAVLADVPRLGGEDDCGVPVDREQDVGVAVDDREPAQVGDGALEAGVFGAAHDRGVEAVALERRADVRVPACYLVHGAMAGARHGACPFRCRAPLGILAAADWA